MVLAEPASMSPNKLTVQDDKSNGFPDLHSAVKTGNHLLPEPGCNYRKIPFHRSEQGVF